MKIRPLMAALALFSAIAVPSLASAYTTAYSAPGTSNMRAGPGTEYPVIARVLSGSRVNVVGCLQSGSWCDVIVQDFRGWMSTTRLEFVYAGSRVPLPRYYSYFDVPVIGFNFGYWDRYYSDRPWYRYRPHRRDRPSHGDPCAYGNCGDGGGWTGGTPDWDGGSGNDGGWDGGTPAGGGNDGGWQGGTPGGDVAVEPGGGNDGGGWQGGTPDGGGAIDNGESGWGSSSGVCPPDQPC